MKRVRVESAVFKEADLALEVGKKRCGVDHGSEGKGIESGEVDDEAVHVAGERFGDVGGDDEVLPCRMEGAEYLEVLRIKTGGVQFALDGIRDTPAAGDDEINLVLILVPPMQNLRSGGIRQKAIKDEMLPEKSAIPRLQVGPAAGEGDEAGIEAINLGPSDQFALAATGIGADEGGDVGEFQHVEVGEHGGPAETAEAGERREEPKETGHL